MKRKVMLICALVIWLLGACTFLSIKIEKEMTPQVTAISPNNSAGFGSAQLPIDCLFSDETGTHLYMISEGTGWEAGMRIREQSGGYNIDEDKIQLSNGWGDFVQYASKSLTVGEAVEVITSRTTEADHWLVIYPDAKAELVEQAAPLPFMEDRAQSILSVSPDIHIYSLSEMECLLDNVGC